MLEINESITLGLDIGMASVGWALISEKPLRIEDAGVWLFSAPETSKERTPLNQIRREKRLLRRVIKRKRQRMNEVRTILFRYGLIPHDKKDVIAICQKSLKTSPWVLRAQGAERQLTKEEFAVCLYHMAKHRGFLSNRKGGVSEGDTEGKKALSAMNDLEEIVKKGSYTTFAQALVKDDRLAGSMRNREGHYGRTPKRQWIEKEAEALFDAQQRFNASFVQDELKQKFINEAFFQNPLQDSITLLGSCPFEENEKRAARHAPSFERFRFLQKLTTLKLKDPETTAGERSFAKEEIDVLDKYLGKQKTISYKTVRKLLKLQASVSFTNLLAVRDDKAENKDIVTNTTKGCAAGTSALREVLGKFYGNLADEQRDNIASVLSFYEDTNKRAEALRDLDLPEEILQILAEKDMENRFADFSGAGHISALACRKLIPHLKEGLKYNEACEQIGYDHTSPGNLWLNRLRAKKQELLAKSPTQIRKLIAETVCAPQAGVISSPVARKAFMESIKQFVALVNNHPALQGKLPGKVHIELARDVGKGPKERRKLESVIRDGAKEREKREKNFKELFPSMRVNANVLKIYALAQQQKWKCIYTGKPITPGELFEDSYQVDHILPLSRFGDDSFANQVLCRASANQHKKNRTPHEWMHSGEATTPSFEEFEQRVHTLFSEDSINKKKAKNLLLQDAAEKEEAFRTRNLNDTRWATKAVLNALELFYPDKPNKEELSFVSPATRRVYARPGPLTSSVRKALGVENLKKNEEGQRLRDDRHHAIDAIIVACISESMLQRFTNASKEAEMRNTNRDCAAHILPFQSCAEKEIFRQDVNKIYENITVARAPDVKVAGQKHAETIYGMDTQNQIIFERITPDDLLTHAEKGREEPEALRAKLETYFHNPERSRTIIDALIKWSRSKRAESHYPAGPGGNRIRKIKVIAKSKKPEISIRNGSAGRGDIVRIDVFSRSKSSGKNMDRKNYFIVPVYPHQLHEPTPPMHVITANKPEAEWVQIDESFQFEFSLSKRDWIRLVKPNKETEEGYYQGVDRSNGSLSLLPHNGGEKLIRVGAQSLLSLEKFHIDRLGKLHKVKKGARQWRGG